MTPITLVYHSSHNGFGQVRYRAIEGEGHGNKYWVIQDQIDGIEICSASKDWEADTPLEKQWYPCLNIELPKGNSPIDKRIYRWLENHRIINN